YASRLWRQYDGGRPPKYPVMADLPLTGDPNVVAPLSSRGPTGDGMLKPDIVAPGVGIAAALSHHSQSYVKPAHRYVPAPDPDVSRPGPSWAAPAVAGAAALVREYRASSGHAAPSGALVKAMLINGARWLPGPTWEDPAIGMPNFHQGFGCLDLS